MLVIFAAAAAAAHAADKAAQPTTVSDLRKAGGDARYWGKAALDCARAARSLRVPGEEEGQEALASADSVDAFMERPQAYQTTNRDEMVRARWDAEEKWGIAQEAFAECNLRRLAQEFDADREPLDVPTRGGGVGGGVVLNVDGGPCCGDDGLGVD